jgi:hypothetical protein
VLLTLALPFAAAGQSLLQGDAANGKTPLMTAARDGESSGTDSRLPSGSESRAISVSPSE